MDAVKKELAIPIPALIGQKTWREERTTNINDAIKALVTSFRSLTTCRAAQIHTSHSVAPMVVLTNSLIGRNTEVGVRSITKKEVTRFIQIMKREAICSVVIANRLKLQKCDDRSEYFQLFFLSSE